MYGIQTILILLAVAALFENDVKMYGIQTQQEGNICLNQFENDVKMYGIQTVILTIR